MGVPRLRTDNTVCFMIDVQENILTDMYEYEALVERCAYVGKIATVLELPTVMTEHVKRVFGPTVPAVRDAIPSNTAVYDKSRFSAVIEPVRDWLEEVGRPNVIVAGIEAHICVLQTSLELLDLGYQVFLATDAISGGEPDQIPVALRRMEQAGAIPTGCVAATYELLEDGKHPLFKSCLGPVKELRSAKAIQT